ncbi:TSC22 domain family protein 2 [Gastrophryne carolinensis]
MSKMPAKKKSCFQITSVTTAQAASSITEDTESLDDPDESRTEDVSSEIFDVSRATDYGAEEEEVVAAADRSSSEETLNNVGEAADTPGTLSPNMPPEGSLPGNSVAPVSRQPPVAACSSRFRVIKLDHGSGEPYRRGRWTCTEFYDKPEQDSSTVLSRTSDTIRHTSSVYEHSTDRDSGLGATGGSSVISTGLQGHDSIADSSALGAGTHMAWHQPSPLGGAMSQGPVYAAPGPSQQQMMLQPDQAYPAGHNGPQNVSLAPTSVTISQSQQLTYPQGHLMGMQAQHVLPPSPVIGSPSSLPGHQLQFVALHPKSNDSVSQGSGLTGHIQPSGSVAPASVSSAAPPQQKPVNQQQVSGGSPASGIRTSISGLPNSAPGVPVTMPISPATFVQSPLSSHTSVSRSNSLIPTTGLSPVQGTTNVHSSQFATQLDDRRKSEPLPQQPTPLISEKSFVKVPITDPLTNPLHLPVFGLPIPVDGEDDRNPSSAFYEAFQVKFHGSKKLGDSSSSANVVAIDNKIEQAMDLVKSHLMYAVREEVEVLREQIKELIEKNSTLERENALLKSLSNSEQLSQLSPQAGLSQQQPPVTTAPQTAHPPQQPNVSSA